LTYVVTDNSFYATISDTGESAYEEDIKDIPHEVAEFLVGEEEYNKLKDIHKEHLEATPPETEENTPDEVKNAFKEVIRLARAGQQPWWSEELKNKSEKTINKVEEYYKDKYDK
jgi:pyruvate-formate lyase-activating enzyme